MSIHHVLVELTYKKVIAVEISDSLSKNDAEVEALRKVADAYANFEFEMTDTCPEATYTISSPEDPYELHSI